MTQSATVAEQIRPKPDLVTIPAAPQNYSGIVLPPFDPEAAIAALKSFYEGSPEEQRETYEYLRKSLSLDEEKKNVSGIAFQPLDVEKALLLLDQLDNFDVTEQRETFEYLRQALNEERAASGERLLFP